MLMYVMYAMYTMYVNLSTCVCDSALLYVMEAHTV